MNHYQKKIALLRMASEGISVIVVDPEGEYKQIAQTIGFKRVNSRDEISEDDKGCALFNG